MFNASTVPASSCYHQVSGGVSSSWVPALIVGIGGRTSSHEQLNQVLVSAYCQSRPPIVVSASLTTAMAKPIYCTVVVWPTCSQVLCLNTHHSR